MTAVMNTAQQVDAFVSAIFDAVDLVEIRLLPSGKQRWEFAGNLSDTVRVLPWLEDRNAAGENIFIGINPRRRKGGTAKDVLLARCLVVDFDGQGPDQQQRTDREIAGGQ